MRSVIYRIHKLKFLPMPKEWIELEHLVKLIEKSISPDSIVDHDVKLPVLNSQSGAKSQCDIVIRSGKPPRETITIVEVQKRNKRVDINDFRGWFQKVEDVGAQHLICVSRHDFPKSIKEKAFFSGNKVRLVTLQKLEVENIPLVLLNTKYEYVNFNLKAIKKYDTGYSKSELEQLGILEKVRSKVNSKEKIDTNTKIFSLDRKKMVSLFLLCRDLYSPPNGTITGEGAISFKLKNGHELYMCEADCFYRVRLDCEFEWSKEVLESPISVLSYEQIRGGSLAWVVEVSHQSPKGIISFKMPVVKSGDNYIVGDMMLKKPPDVSLTLHLSNNSESPH